MVLYVTRIGGLSKGIVVNKWESGQIQLACLWEWKSLKIGPMLTFENDLLVKNGVCRCLGCLDGGEKCDIDPRRWYWPRN